MQVRNSVSTMIAPLAPFCTRTTAGDDIRSPRLQDARAEIAVGFRYVYPRECRTTNVGGIEAVWRTRAIMTVALRRIQSPRTAPASMMIGEELKPSLSTYSSARRLALFGSDSITRQRRSTRIARFRVAIEEIHPTFANGLRHVRKRRWRATVSLCNRIVLWYERRFRKLLEVLIR